MTGTIRRRRSASQAIGAAFAGLGLAIAAAGCGGKALVDATCGPGSGSRVLYTSAGNVDFAVAGDRVAVEQQDSVSSVPVAGGAATRLVQGVASFGVVVAQGKVFYIGEDGPPKSSVEALFSVPLAGGQPQLFADAAPTGKLLTDGDSLYFEGDFGIVEVDAKSGATIKLPFDPQLPPPELAAVQGGFVYMLAKDPPDGRPGVIERIPKQGGAVQRIYSSSSGYVELLTADASGLYWNEIEAGTYGSGSIRHANLDGSSPETLLPDIRALSLAPGGGALYFSEGDRIAKLTVDGHETTFVGGLVHPDALQLSRHDAVWRDQVKTDPGAQLIEAACVR